jgi:hypothetical protein
LRVAEDQFPAGRRELAVSWLLPVVVPVGKLAHLIVIVRGPDELAGPEIEYRHVRLLAVETT